MKKSHLVLTAALFAVGAAHSQEALKKIKETGTLTIGARESSGLSYSLGNGVFTGFHVEVCQRIASRIQRELGLSQMTIKYVPVTSPNRLAMVQSDTVDLECGSTTNNLARQKDVDFAMTTYVEEVRMAVKDGSGINSVADLNGKTVATTTGTTSVATLRKNRRASGLQIKEVFGKDHTDSFAMLESGRADAFVLDASILAANIAKSKKPSDYKIVGEVLSVEPIAIMMHKNDPNFKKTVDAAIKSMVDSGDMAKLWDKWFMQPIPPNNVKVGLPLNAATKDAWAHPNDKPMEDYAQK